jgi:hypothetical protein
MHKVHVEHACAFAQICTDLPLHRFAKDGLHWAAHVPVLNETAQQPNMMGIYPYASDTAQKSIARDEMSEGAWTGTRMGSGRGERPRAPRLPARGARGWRRTSSQPRVTVR